MKAQPIQPWDRETTLVGQLAAGVSLLAFLFYFRHGDLLLYGDAVAHINIARRVFDSQTPGLLQLGTVWLPLPHLLMMPFLLSTTSWQTGIGGAIPSLIAFVVGTIGIFRLVRGSLTVGSEPNSNARIAAWIAAFVYATNPNMLYMQTTAMTEPLYLALFIWSVVHFSEFVRSGDRKNAKSSLMKGGWCLAAACLTRYDGWFLAGVIGLAALLVAMRSKRTLVPTGVLAKFVLLAAAAPALWFGYNWAVYRNPLEFANGPYSARAIEDKVTVPGSPPPYSGWHDPKASFSYFLKAAEDNMAMGGLQRAWVLLLLLGVCVLVATKRAAWPLLVLLVPIPFYVLSIAYGSVPIYLPEWWPFSYYNVRFGMELIPAFAAFFGVIVDGVGNRIPQMRQKLVVVGVAIVFVGAGYGFVWKAQPICYREAYANSRTRIAFETALASNLQLLPRDSTILMYLGDHVGALQRAAIALRRTINEGNHRSWVQPSDPQGLWERALADPRRYANYVVAIEGDPVATKVRKPGLTSMLVIRTTGQPPATIYWTQRSDR